MRSVIRRARLIAGRVGHDYVGRDRGLEYRSTLARAVEAGYELTSLMEFHAQTGTVGNRDHRLIALRHDVDITDVAGNEAFYLSELAMGARSTFYFRLSTVSTHASLIRRLLADGFEVGYHFEEAASLAREAAFDRRSSVELLGSTIADRFRRNCDMFRVRWNPGLSSVSAHGDWVNRRLGFTNQEFVGPDLLSECGLRFEAYGPDLLGRVDAYVSDVAVPPSQWTGNYGLEDALGDRHTRICVLTHERRWHVNRRAAATADLNRMASGVAYSWRTAVARLR